MNIKITQDQNPANGQLMTNQDLSGFKVRFTQEAVHSDLCENAIVFNCTRPLVGHKTWNGDYVSGTYYAAIDPDDNYAAEYIATNLKLDACIPMHVSDIDRLGMYLAIANPVLRARVITHIEKVGIESASAKVNNSTINNLPWKDFKWALLIGRILIVNLKARLSKNSKTQGEMA